MDTENKSNGTESGASQENQEQKPDITKLPIMEMSAVLGLELGKTIFERLTKMEESLEILIRQKALDLKSKRTEEN